jgi:hypothetical protein
MHGYVKEGMDDFLFKEFLFFFKRSNLGGVFGVFTTN